MYHLLFASLDEPVGCRLQTLWHVKFSGNYFLARGVGRTISCREISHRLSMKWLKMARSMYYMCITTSTWPCFLFFNSWCNSNLLNNKSVQYYGIFRGTGKVILQKKICELFFIYVWTLDLNADTNDPQNLWFKKQ